jgi:hypothetical protein
MPVKDTPQMRRTKEARQYRQKLHFCETQKATKESGSSTSLYSQRLHAATMASKDERVAIRTVQIARHLVNEF